MAENVKHISYTDPCHSVFGNQWGLFSSTLGDWWRMEQQAKTQNNNTNIAAGLQLCFWMTVSDISIWKICFFPGDISGTSFDSFKLISYFLLLQRSTQSAQERCQANTVLKCITGLHVQRFLTLCPPLSRFTYEEHQACVGRLPVTRSLNWNVNSGLPGQPWLPSSGILLT